MSSGSPTTAQSCIAGCSIYVLVHFWGVDQNIAYLLQAFVSIESSFVLNRWLNWDDRVGNIWLQLLKFNISKFGIVALNQIIFVFLVSRGVHYLLVAIAGVTIATIINYFINDRFVFTNFNVVQLQTNWWLSFPEYTAWSVHTEKALAWSCLTSHHGVWCYRDVRWWNAPGVWKAFR